MLKRCCDHGHSSELAVVHAPNTFDLSSTATELCSCHRLPNLAEFGLRIFQMPHIGSIRVVPGARWPSPLRPPAFSRLSVGVMLDFEAWVNVLFTFKVVTSSKPT